MSGWLGRTIGNYRIEAALGLGGMGRVFRAVHIHINRVAAIKVLHEQIAIDPAFQARFLREAQAVAALHHPNIVDILDFNEDDGIFYLVMEYVPDGSLRTLLKEQTEQGRTLPLATGLDLIRQAADALDYAHRAGMVHRDIKPDNLLIKRDPLTGNLVVKVADFGLARMSDSTALTVEGQTMGTPAYMSPEQCQGIDLDGRSDLYSLGVVLFEVATGAVPFVMKSLTDAIYKHVYVPPPSPRDVRPDLPDALNEIILRCLAKDPAERFATAGQLAEALRQLGDVSDAAGVAPVPAAEQLQIMLDSGEVPLTPGQSTALTVTIVNRGQTPVRASLSIEGVPEEWVASPPRDVEIAPGAEVSGPLRVEVPGGAGVKTGEYPVIVRAESADHLIRAEASTRLVVSAVQAGPQTLVVPPVTGGPPPPPPPPMVSDARSEPGRPAWLTAAALAVLLLVVAGIAYALLRPDDSEDDDNQIAAGATETETDQAASTATETVTEGIATSAATATLVIIVDPAETPTEAVEVSETPTGEPQAAATDTPAPALPAEFIMFSTGRNLDDPAGTLDIYVMDPDGANQRPIISEPDDDWLAAISPDGAHIAWVSRQHGNHQIYLVHSDGSGLRRLTNSSGDDLHPVWSSDNVHIIFSRNEDGDEEIYKINIQDDTLTRLTDNNAYDGYAAWSPDGTQVAWTSGVDGNNEIYIRDITDESATPRRLTDNPQNDFNPVWSPDGSQILFVSNRFGDNDIFVMPANGSSGPTQLTTDSASDFAPAWSPDGSKIAFCRVKDTVRDVVMINTDGSGETIVASNASPNDPDITWSPDSAHIAYLSEDAGNYDVWTVALDGSQAVQLTDAPGNDANLTWFSQGR